ncbi:MAG: anhydro-N-acetylmuramic acid kinase [Gammaproteobacteria bacterium]|nr:anhydro-N-acetylmuramic acid kinase [Gammaproteobacteria bacterium]
MTELYIGLMSGTSMDGIDAALVDLGSQPFNLICHHSHPLPPALKKKLLTLAHNEAGIDLDTLGEVDAELGELFAAATLALLKKSQHSASSIKAIGSHGQTIRHRPDIKYPFSLQIADANRIAYKTGISTVADFRRRDMAAGGEGAPLAPAFHKIFFRSNDESRGVLNIGGIANITYLPADDGGSCSGFDTGPGNILMDGWIQKHQGKSFDKNGQWAASAQADPELVAHFMNDRFISRIPPKSTGREHYNLQWLERQLQNFSDLSAAIVQASLCEFTAQSIRYAIETHTPDIKTLIICGGGAHNVQLMQLLKATMPDIHIASSDQYELPPDWIEAVAFAWLAKQTLTGQPGNLPDVTGALKPVILGAVYPAENSNY